ncbi:hypothetical protein ACWX0O_01750 [Nitrobacteraceae bacterium UC4449_H16]
MTTEPTAQEKALAAQGATPADLDAGASGTDGAPKAPAAPSNEPPKPVKEGLDEESGVPVVVDPAKAAADKEAADKVAADKAAADKEAAGPLKTYSTFEESPAANAAIGLLKEAGIGPNEANGYFAKAIASGDLKDVDVAGLEAKLGKDKTTLVMAGVTAHYEGLTKKAEATVAQTHEIFGGADNWNTVREWAHVAEKADAKIKSKIDGIRSLLDEGGVRAEAGARELLRMYNAAPDNKGLGTSKLAVGDSTGTVVGTVLTRAQYNIELKAAHERGAKRAEIQALDARRRAGMKAGI